MRRLPGILIRALVRWTLRLLTALSLAACAAVAALWVRGYFVGEAYHWTLPQRGDPFADDTLTLISGRGGVCFSLDRWAAWELGERKPTRATLHPRRFSYSSFATRYPYALGRPWYKRWGFEWSGFEEAIAPTSVGSGIVYARNLVVPSWALFLVTAALPTYRGTLWWRRARVRDHRRAYGLCLTCGYDLRGSPERCPECGTTAGMMA